MIKIPKEIQQFTKVNITNLDNFMNFNSKHYNSININKQKPLGYISFPKNKALVDILDKDNIVHGKEINLNKQQKGNITVIGGGKKASKTINKSNAPKDSITIARVGNPGMVHFHTKPVYVTDDAFFIIVPKKCSYTPLEIYALLKGMQSQLHRVACGSVQHYITLSELYSFRVPVLTKKQHQQLISNIKKDSQQFSSVTKNLTKVRKHEADLADNAINSGERMTIKNLVDKGVIHELFRGKSAPMKLPDIARSNHFYPTIKNFKYNTIDLKSSQTISDDSYKTLSNRSMKQGDVFISAEGSIGKVGVITKDLLSHGTINLNDHTNDIRIIQAKKLKPLFLMLELTSPTFQDELNSKASGNEMPGVGKSDIKSCHISLLSKAKQDNICKQWNDLAKKETTLQSQKDKGEYSNLLGGIK